MDCHFSKLVPVSPAKRFWLSFGAGKSITEVSGEIREASSGRVVARIVHARMSWCCGFGSNDHEITTNLAGAAEDIAGVLAGSFYQDQQYEWLPDTLVAETSKSIEDTEKTVSTLQIDSTQENSEVEIDEKFVGTTPLELQVQAGTHQISVRRSGFETWSKQIDILSGSKQKVVAELQKVQ